MNNNYQQKLYDVKGTKFGVFIIDNTYQLIPHVVIYNFRGLIIIDCLFIIANEVLQFKLTLKGLLIWQVEVLAFRY